MKFDIRTDIKALSLLRGVIAAPDDDLARLVFADYVQEAGDLDLAQFIRDQCELSRLTPAATDYFDLTDRQHEFRVWSQQPWWGLGQPKGFADPDNPTPYDFRRGFPRVIEVTRRALEAEPELATAFSQSPARDLDLTPAGAAGPAALLGQPAAVELRGLRLSGRDWAAIETALRGPAAAGLERLDFKNQMSAAAMRALADAPLDRLCELTLDPSDAHAAFERLLASNCFARLQVLDVRVGHPRHGDALAAALGRAKNLHTLTLSGPSASASIVARAGVLPALARLEMRCVGPRPGDLASLATARLPVLCSLGVGTVCDWSVFEALTASGLASGLKHWPGGAGAFGSEGLRRLAAVGATRLRGLASVSYDAGVPAALGTPGAFREVRHLSLSGGTGVVLDAEFFRAADLPALTRLELSGPRIDPAAARAMRVNPSFARLVQLHLYDVRFGPDAVRELLAGVSERLTTLNVQGGDELEFVRAMCDPGVAPGLRDIEFYGTRVPDTLRDRLRAARPGIAVWCR